jgi:hypothetical protein
LVRSKITPFENKEDVTLIAEELGDILFLFGNNQIFCKIKYSILLFFWFIQHTHTLHTNKKKDGKKGGCVA